MTKSSLHCGFLSPPTTIFSKTRSENSDFSGFEALLRKSPLKNTVRERALRLLQKLQSNEQVMGAPTQAHERWGFWGELGV